jgi:glycosyltransferase involved in cell wall biosynthesis
MVSKMTKVLPPGSKRRIAAGRIKNLILHGTLGPNYKYKIWIKNHEPNTLSSVLQDQDLKISIVLPAYNTPDKYIQQLIDSVIGQTYKNWQLCIADGSTDETRSEAIRRISNTDERISYIKTEGNLGISGNTNMTFSFVKGSYIAFLDHDDILPAWAMNEVATEIKDNPKSEILYSDEDRLSENGKNRITPLFKPDWSPDLFLSANYITHLFVIKKSLMNKLGGLRSEFDGSQDYDLSLRAIEYNPVITHIPKILYHMRMAKGSTAKAIGEKDYAHNTGKQALKDYLKRNHIEASVLDIKDRPTNHRVKYRLAKPPKVSIIIPFKDKAELLKACLKSMEKTSYKNYEVILVSNNSEEPKTLRYLKSLKDKHIKLFEYNHPFNYSAINNFGRKKASGSVLVFLNNDTEVLDKGWLEELASVAIRKDTAAVGPLLLYPDRTIQHAGVVLGLTGMAGHIFRDLKLGTLTPFWLPDWPRDYLAVTGACLAVEAKKFDQIGGFREEFIMAGSDVVLCLDFVKAGYKNVYWPFARLLHHESKSVISYKNAPPSDYDNSLIHYREYLDYKDPYFNPNLNIESEIPILRTKYE